MKKRYNGYITVSIVQFVVHWTDLLKFTKLIPQRERDYYVPEELTSGL